MRERVFTIVSNTTGVSPHKISETDRIEDLTEDSIKLFELLTNFEREFDHTVSYEDIATIETVEDIITYIERAVLPRKDASVS